MAAILSVTWPEGGRISITDLAKRMGLFQIPPPKRAKYGASKTAASITLVLYVSRAPVRTRANTRPGAGGLRA